MARFPAVNPITEGWFGRGTPLDHLGVSTEPCSVCDDLTQQDRFRAMLSRHIGVGLPFFLGPLATRASTRGKLGRRSLWSQCQRCRSVFPLDDEAQTIADGFGRSDGFLNRPGDGADDDER